MPQQPPFDPTSLGQVLSSNPGVREYLGWKEDITPYEALRDLQKRRAEDPDIDEGLKLVESRFGPLQIPEAPTWGGTFAKHAVNELGFGLPQRYHWAGFNITPEEQNAPGSGWGSTAGMLGGFLLPAGALGGAAKGARALLGAGRAAKGLEGAANLFRTGEAAGKVLGSPTAGKWAHGGLMMGIGGAQGISRNLNTQQQQIAEGKRTGIDTNPLVAEAVGNALLAPFGGALTGSVVKGLAPRAARNVGMALGAAKGVGGMGILGGAQRMTENPGMNPIDATLGQDPTMLLAGAVGGGLAGRGRLAFLSPGGKYLKGVYGELDDAARAAKEAAAPAAPAVEPLGAPGGTSPAIQQAAPGTGVPPPSVLSTLEQNNPLFSQYQAISKLVGSPVQRLVAGGRNRIETLLSGMKDLIRESGYEPQYGITKSGEVISTTGSTNKFGARAGAFTRQGQAQLGGIQNLDRSDLVSHLEPSNAATPHVIPADQYTRIQGKPVFATVEGQPVQVKYEAPDHWLAITQDKSRLVQIPKPAPATESLGAGAGGVGGDAGTGIASELASRSAAANAAQVSGAEAASQSRLKLKDFQRLENVVMQILNEPGFEGTLSEVMAQNPDLAPYISFIAKRAHAVTAPKGTSAFATAKTSTRLQEEGPNAKPRRKKTGQQGLPGI